MSQIIFNCDKKTLARVDAAVEAGVAASREDFLAKATDKAFADALAAHEADEEKKRKAEAAKAAKKASK